MAEEILNIEFHHKRLMLIALNKHQDHITAASHLNIDVRTLYKWIRKYQVKRTKQTIYTIADDKAGQHR